MSGGDWNQANDRYLSAALDRVRALVAGPEAAADCAAADCAAADAFPEDAPPALETLCATFGLSPFERDVLVLAAGPELDPGFGDLCAQVQADDQPYPTFALALAVLPEAHWSAISPDAALRRWRLLDVDSGPALTASPLRIEERVLHYLRGLETSEPRLTGVIGPLRAGGVLVPSHCRVAERLAAIWARAGDGPPPVVQLVGGRTGGKRTIVAAACRALEIGANVLRATALPTADAELEGFLQLLGREAALGGRVLVLDCDDVAARDEARDRSITAFVEGYRGLLVLTSRERRRLPRCLTVPFDVARPETAEQEALWRTVLGDAEGHRLNGEVRVLAAQFDLSADAIRAAGAEALGRVTDAQEAGGAALAKALWQACLGHARPALEALAERITPGAGWDDLVLPAPHKAALHQIALHLRHRHRVYQDWGFASRSARGLGISALFAGPSGTGKTMAAEVIANQLELDLYCIDLASVVSKYIGETEKNLKKIFDAGEAGGAVLLFDEADALFGKRSEIRDSHDRYANIEVSYLLQRIEQYRGLAILTTNLKNALDPAFMRRIRFIVPFAFPDAAARAEIWRRIFPPQTPTNGLDLKKLAQISVAGGNIRNIALGAAFLAAEDNVPVSMAHVATAVRSEYAKLEKPLTAAEIGGWEA